MLLLENAARWQGSDGGFVKPGLNLARGDGDAVAQLGDARVELGGPLGSGSPMSTIRTWWCW